jgi:RNA polymerase sigma-70 factor (ECF subfamily)
MSLMVSPANPEGEDALHAAPGFLSWVAVLVHTHRARLIAYARRRGLDADEALDAVQDTFVSFLRVPEARPIAERSEDSLKMLTVMLRHHVQNHARKRGRHDRAHAVVRAEAPAEIESSEVLIARAEELARVYGCVRRMARLQRQVVMLSLLDDKPRDEVAGMLGITESHVRVLLHRARERVRSCTFVYDDD